MPISKIGFFRTDGQPNSPKEKVYVPLYSVLFWYGRDIDFVNTPSGTLNFDYYRTYIEIFEPDATFYNLDNTPTSLKCNPIICCVPENNYWNTNTGICYTATTSMPNTGATYFDTNTHNPSKITRSSIYNALGRNILDGPSSTQSYLTQNGDFTHRHVANNVAFNLTTIKYGTYDSYAQSIAGINAVAVKPIIRDPKIVTDLNEVYGEKKLFTLPKNIIVFGNNLPSQYYTRNDLYHANSATGTVLPLIAKKENVGALRIANTLSFTIPSSTVENHNHNLVSLPKSDKSNQTAYALVDAGSHLHQVTYNTTVKLRSKILKAWITNNDSTPIANGVIIGYSLGSTAMYDGVYSNSDILPVNWHFCDGNNGTPDLRGYFVYANFDSANTYHDVVYNPSNTITLDTITMAANGNHSHISPMTGVEIGYGAPADTGSHTYEDQLDHIHTVSTANTFKYNPTDVDQTFNIRTGQTYTYTPPRVQLAFIMYNENIA